MTIAVRPFLLKPQRMNGLSERLLVSHYENNYGGALRRLNAIRARLAVVDWGQVPVFEINGLKREELIAAASVILHEIYFDSLGGDGDNPPTGLAQPSAGLAQALERDFGSVMSWRTEFTAMAKALAGGSGWVILAWSERLGRLVNQWAADHAHGLPGATPILALDMYEHAYHLDFGASAAAYVDQVMANLNWERIGARYRLAIGEEAGEEELFLPFGAPAQEEARISAEELKLALEADEDRRPVLLDLCLPVDLPRRTDMLAGASMHAPAALPRWVEDLPRGRPIAVYCICGFQVSGRAVTELRQRGYDARALVGGITAWHAIGGRTVPLDRTTYTEPHMKGEAMPQRTVGLAEITRVFLKIGAMSYGGLDGRLVDHRALLSSPVTPRPGNRIPEPETAFRRRVLGRLLGNCRHGRRLARPQTAPGQASTGTTPSTAIHPWSDAIPSCKLTDHRADSRCAARSLPNPEP